MFLWQNVLFIFFLSAPSPGNRSFEGRNRTAVSKRRSHLAPDATARTAYTARRTGPPSTGITESYTSTPSSLYRLLYCVKFNVYQIYECVTLEYGVDVSVTNTARCSIHLSMEAVKLKCNHKFISSYLLCTLWYIKNLGKLVMSSSVSSSITDCAFLKK